MPALPESLLPDLKSWAAKQLQVDQGASAEDIRAAYLRRALHENGAPNLTAREALLILKGESNSTQLPFALRSIEETFRLEVEDFARRFFLLRVTERKAEWDRLKIRTQHFVRLDVRLDSLLRGIEIVLPDFRDPSPSDFASSVGELFVLRPRDRAIRREELIEDALVGHGHWDEWIDAARLLQTHNPALTTLEPEFVDRLAAAEIRAEEHSLAGDEIRKLESQKAHKLLREIQKKTPWRRTKIAFLLLTVGLLKLLLFVLLPVFWLLGVNTSKDAQQKTGGGEPIPPKDPPRSTLVSPRLPVELRRWPRSPFRLLGVVPRCEATEVRQAYDALVNQFPPLQYPEHSRLLNEALDTAMRFARISYTTETIERDFTEAAASVSASSQPVSNLTRNSGELANYRALCRLHEAEPTNCDLLFRLYTMLLANQALDTAKTPCDWLVQGLLTEGLWGDCGSLYHRELVDNPEEALSERCRGLLESLVVRRDCIDFLHWRWEGLQQLDRLDFIRDDVKAIGPRLRLISEVSWFQLQLIAADFLFWDTEDTADQISKGIDIFVNDHDTFEVDLTRLDALHEFSESCLRFRKDDPGWVPLLNVMPLVWTSPYRNRDQILASCREIAESPKSSLDRLDQLHSSDEFILAFLYGALEDLWPEAPDPRDEETMNNVILDQMLGLGSGTFEESYKLYRQHLFRFCIDQVIARDCNENQMGNGYLQ